MIRGYRWIKTAPDVWLYEGLPGRFHGKVVELCDGSFSFGVPGGFHYMRLDDDGSHSEEHGCGERATIRLAKDEIEKAIKGQRLEEAK